ncbi:hypothetical protein CEXT_631101 [Caerostris extrusa]|uniref:Uncharacterized protein n=1 Tax=Caerostris extrusa TaxID=172846 RepID=A0AAV4PKR8_CAEEX|nr:hypothetical protein CEXT_631101 [Caerostris extrusa]
METPLYASSFPLVPKEGAREQEVMVRQASRSSAIRCRVFADRLSLSSNPEMVEEPPQSNQLHRHST